MQFHWTIDVEIIALLHFIGYILQIHVLRIACIALRIMIQGLFGGNSTVIRATI